MTKEKVIIHNSCPTFALARRKPSFAMFFGIADSDITVVKQEIWFHLKSEQKRKTCP
jgi:hypothetical protein